MAPLSITVTDGGYAPSASVSGSQQAAIRPTSGGHIEKNHNLQVGDFLLANGLLVGKDALTEEQKASVSAIVFWTLSETTTEGRLTLNFDMFDV